MPVAIAPEDEAAWLEAGTVKADPAAIAFHAVRKLVNNSRAEGPELLEPA
jgi:putative SOS response-associated peptidase YedK